jgi:adenylate cyclase
MTFSNTGSILATLTQLTQLNRTSALTSRVKDLSVPEFICLLDFITAEFQQFLRAIDMINNEALESMMEQVMDAFTLKIGQILQADRTTIFLVDKERGQLWSKIPQNETGKSIETRLPINIGVVGYVARTGEDLNITDAYNNTIFKKEIDEIPGYHTNTLLCMPVLSSKNEVVAVVQLLNKAGDIPFNSEDEGRFKDFAASIGVILETCQSFYMAARNQRGANALLKATTYLGQSLDLEATLQYVMEQARALMQADRSTLFMLSQATNELWTKVLNKDGTEVIPIRIPANKGIAGYVASTGEILNIPNAYDDPRFNPDTDKRTGYHTKSILCMPVYNSKNELIGVTQLINKQSGVFTSSDEEFMRAFNIQAGIALENAQLFENVLLEKEKVANLYEQVLQEQQYQKDILQSLSDAVISTDMEGKIVTINEAALELLGCPNQDNISKVHSKLWEHKLIGRYLWEVIPIENLQFRLQDSLKHGAKHYVPEQNLTVGIHAEKTEHHYSLYHLAIAHHHDENNFILWNNPENKSLSKQDVKIIEKSINLTVNPLTNPEGGVRGGLVVLEDISREKRLKSTMYRYMTPEVAERVMALGDDALMIGERKEVTILFSDIRGYTTLTENLGADEVVSLLNQYFETMVEAVFSYEGTLDKFIGDALMAVYGAPLPLKDHAWMSIQSALNMRSRLEEFNQRRIVQNQPLIHVGIGISSGWVVSGNIGSQKRMDYTVIGDGVNLSSRLESVTKEYGCDIIMSEYTYEMCSDRVWARELDTIRVKGKNKAVNIYQLISDRHTNLDAETITFIELYHQGRAAYLQREFKQAIAYFTEAENINNGDLASLLHLQRCYSYLQNPPAESWDGVHTMLNK